MFVNLLLLPFVVGGVFYRDFGLIPFDILLKNHLRILTMWNIPSQSRLNKIPLLYETEHIPTQDKLIYLHFFIGGSDWYVAEYDGDDVLFGYVVLNDDLDFAEWGYFSFSELKEIRVNGWCEIDCEIEDFWSVKMFSEILTSLNSS